MKILGTNDSIDVPACRALCSIWNPPCYAWDSALLIGGPGIDFCTLYTFTDVDVTDNPLVDHLVAASDYVAGTFNCKLGMCVAYEMTTREPSKMLPGLI